MGCSNVTPEEKIDNMLCQMRSVANVGNSITSDDRQKHIIECAEGIINIAQQQKVNVEILEKVEHTFEKVSNKEPSLARILGAYQDIVTSLRLRRGSRKKYTRKEEAPISNVENNDFKSSIDKVEPSSCIKNSDQRKYSFTTESSHSEVVYDRTVLRSFEDDGTSEDYGFFEL